MIGITEKCANRLGSISLLAFQQAAVAVLIAGLFSTGCNSSPDGSEEVMGVVVVDGQPAAQGAIVFTPVDGKSPTAGSQIVDGKYETRVAVGESRVVIRVPKVVGQRKLYDTPDSPVQQILKESLPAKYNDATELEVDVQGGANEFNFDLSSS